MLTRPKDWFDGDHPSERHKAQNSWETKGGGES